jgi:hypothetical protein
VLVHAMLIIGLGLFALRRMTTPAPVDTTFVRITHPVDVSPDDSFAMPEPMIREPLPETKAVVTDPEDVYYPPDTAWNDQGSVDPGDPLATDFETTMPRSSTAISVGEGPGGRGSGVTPFSNPQGPLRDLRVGRGDGGPPLGPTVSIDKAVRHGLLWLCRHQNPDGSWSPRSMREHCTPKSPCLDPKIAVNDHYDEGLTALAVLAFLGAGFTHQSDLYLLDPLDAKRYRTGEVVKNGLDWLKKRQNPDGSFSRDRPFLYNEALATMALSEAYGMTGARYWREAAQRGVDFLQSAQRPSPTPDPRGAQRWGWRYASRDDVEKEIGSATDTERLRLLYDADTSVTAWCVMALKSAELSKLAVDPASLAGALEFAKFVTADDGSVGYLDRASAGATLNGPYSEAFAYHPTTMCALGMCIRIFTAHDPNDPILERSANRIVADLPTVSKDTKSIDYYYWYYASLALNQLDGPDSPKKSGKYWAPWNKAMVDAVLALQDTSPRSCREGGWIMNDRWASASGAGAIYSTALSVLTLEVYYRYPNAFGRRGN